MAIAPPPILQAAVYETVIGVGAQATFNVGIGMKNDFDIGDKFNPTIMGSTVAASWYEPVNNLQDLSAFANITVSPASPASDDVSLHLEGGTRSGLLQIRVHALFYK